MNKNFKKCVGVLFLCAVVAFIVFYNYKRIMGVYEFGFRKEISINLIPFKDIATAITYFESNLILKIIYFTAIGALIQGALTMFEKTSLKLYALLCLASVVIVELLCLFTKGFLVTIDANNFLLYAVGFVLGYFCFNIFALLLKKLLAKTTQAN